MELFVKMLCQVVALEACRALPEGKSCLELLPESLQGNRVIVMSAVKKDGLLLQHVRHPLNLDDGINCSSVENTLLALPFVDDKAKKRPELVLSVRARLFGAFGTNTYTNTLPQLSY